MSTPMNPLLQARVLVARRPMLRWLFAVLLVVNAAVPMLAAVAAHQQNVALGELCSIYGVRTASLEQGQPHGSQDHGQHAGGKHCTLTSALGAVLVAGVPAPAVVLHAPAAPRAAGAPVFEFRVDRPFTWLVARIHAPPFRA
jgi:hypothetical protein